MLADGKRHCRRREWRKSRLLGEEAKFEQVVEKDKSQDVFSLKIISHQPVNMINICKDSEPKKAKQHEHWPRRNFSSCLTNFSKLLLLLVLRQLICDKRIIFSSSSMILFGQALAIPPPMRPLFKNKIDLDITIQEGDPMLLRCELDDIPLTDITAAWVKDQSYTIAFWNDQTPLEMDGRFQLTGDPKRGDYTLKLNKAKLNDSGSYICQVFPKEGAAPGHQIEEYRLLMNITVVKAPTISAPHGWRKLSASSPGLGTNDFATNVNYVSPAYVSRRLTSAASTSISTAHNHHGTSAKSFIALNWPYALMALLGCLFLVNIYLISRLVQTCRQRRRQKNLANGKNSQQGCYSSASTSTTSTSSKPSSQCSLSC